MDEPTLEEVRAAKAELLTRLAERFGFAGIGIGTHQGRLAVRVNWRRLPPAGELPQRVGKVEVTHHEVGDIRAQPE
jgi:hypothetical protein